MYACRLLAAASLASAGFVALSSSGAHADAPEASGYWTKAQVPSSSPVTVPAPPTVPSGGLYVANDPSGPTAISAVRYVVPEGVEGTLALKIAAGSTPQVANISACTATTSWDPPSGAGDMANAPKYAPSTCVIGQLAPDNSVYTFLLSPAQQPKPGTIDVVLIPTPAAGPQPFSVSFEHPGGDSLATSPAPEEESAPSQSPEPVVAPSEPQTAPTVAPSTGTQTYAPASGGSDTAAPILSTPTASKPVVAPRTAARPALPAAQPVVAAKVPDDQGQRLLAVGLLLALAAGLWWVGGRPARPPRLLGPFGNVAVTAATDVAVTTATTASAARGVGRFARLRTAAARRL